MVLLAGRTVSVLRCLAHLFRFLSGQMGAPRTSVNQDEVSPEGRLWLRNRMLLRRFRPLSSAISQVPPGVTWGLSGTLLVFFSSRGEDSVSGAGLSRLRLMFSLRGSNRTEQSRFSLTSDLRLLDNGVICDLGVSDVWDFRGREDGLTGGVCGDLGLATEVDSLILDFFDFFEVFSGSTEQHRSIHQSQITTSKNVVDFSQCRQHWWSCFLIAKLTYAQIVQSTEIHDYGSQHDNANTVDGLPMGPTIAVHSAQTQSSSAQSIPEHLRWDPCEPQKSHSTMAHGFLLR